MVRAIYDVSALVAWGFATWGLGQIGNGIGAVHRWIADGPEEQPSQTDRRIVRHAGASSYLRSCLSAAPVFSGGRRAWDKLNTESFAP